MRAETPTIFDGRYPSCDLMRVLSTLVSASSTEKDPTGARKQNDIIFRTTRILLTYIGIVKGGGSGEATITSK